MAVALTLAAAVSTAAEPPAGTTRAPTRAADDAVAQAEFLEFLGSTGAEDEAFLKFLARADESRPATQETAKQVTPQKTASRSESNER